MSAAPRVILPLLLAAMTVLPSVAVAAQQSELERDLDEAKVFYRDGRLDEAVSSLRDVIAQLNMLRDQQNRRTQLAEAHLYLGLSYFAVRDESAALQNFRQVAALDPGRVLDPEIYSPRVMALFEQAREDVAGSRAPAPAALPPAAENGNEASTPGNPVGAVLLPPGTRARVTLAGVGRPVIGSVQAFDSSRITLIDDESRSLSFPTGTISQLEVSRGRKAHWLMGTIVGISSGALIGALDPPGCDSDGTCWTRGENIGYGATGLGLIGALVGALYRSDEWVEVSVSRSPSLVRVTTTTDPGIVVSFAWRY